MELEVSLSKSKFNPRFARPKSSRQVPIIYGVPQQNSKTTYNIDAANSLLLVVRDAEMRGLNLKASRVYQTASLLLESQSISQPPPWFKTIGSIPPGEIMTRTQPVQHRNTDRKSRIRKPSKMFKPKLIEYEEDRLRREFYGDHPWELARPRIVLEDDGKDAQKCDWSRIQQPGRALTGESVIQRQLWLLNNVPDMTNAQAYDIARKEFYALRNEEEVERRVAREEALWTGAYFGKSALEVGMELEDETYESWKAWATKEVEAIDLQRNSAYTGLGTDSDEAQADLESDPAEVAII